MSKREVETIFKQAMSDLEFRAKLFKDPEKTLEDKDISPDELKVLSSIKLNEHGDFEDIRALDEIDPAIVKKSLPISSDTCGTLFCRCY